jgi:GTPase
MKKPVVAIVGRPNVGKSCLFNRILGKRVAVVDDLPGITRDRNYMDTDWDNVKFILTDTGGIIPHSDEPIPREIRNQVDYAIAESQAIIFLVDAQTGPTDFDLDIARMLRKKAAEKVVLAANKAESKTSEYDSSIFMSMGLGEPYPISALHGLGIGSMLDRICVILRSSELSQTSEAQPGLHLAIIGRPNVGKSSLVNKLLNKKRMIVDDVPGTTRDAIDSRMIHNGSPVILIDTAGLRKKTKVEWGFEYYANLRALDSIRRADVCAVIIDAERGFSEQDLKIIEQVQQYRKGIILCFNKWDLVKKDDKTFDHLMADLRGQYAELKYAPCISISALTGQRVSTVIDRALKVKEEMSARVPTSEFKANLLRWVREKPHPVVSNQEVRILGGKQAQAAFPLFLFFTANASKVKPSYARYLANQIHEYFGFAGCPVILTFKQPGKPGRRRPMMAAGVQNENSYR